MRTENWPVSINKLSTIYYNNLKKIQTQYSGTTTKAQYMESRTLNVYSIEKNM